MVIQNNSQLKNRHVGLLSINTVLASIQLKPMPSFNHKCLKFWILLLAIKGEQLCLLSGSADGGGLYTILKPKKTKLFARCLP